MNLYSLIWHESRAQTVLETVLLTLIFIDIKFQLPVFELFVI